MSLIKLEPKHSSNERIQREWTTEGPEAEIRPHLGPEYAPQQRAGSPVIESLVPSRVDGMYLGLLTKTRTICEKSRLEFSLLSAVQRKFITHYRCPQCGLQPLYHLDLTHMKRARCGKCGQTVPLKNNGKYGRLRKEIAIELWREDEGWRGHIC